MRRIDSGMIAKLARRLRARRRPVREPWFEDCAALAGSALFDAGFYLNTYPDVRESGVDPLEHYVRYGAAEGRDPGPGFSTTGYLQANPDVAAAGINPLRHYVEFGRAEGRDIAASTTRSSPDEPDTSGLNRRLVDSSGLFDAAHYLRQLEDNSAASASPLEHYLAVGATNRLAPCADFDPEFYLSVNPDVARSGMNPLVHYVRYGADELRSPSRAFDASWYWLDHLARSDSPEADPLVHYRAIGRRQALAVRESGAPVDRDAVVEACEFLLGTGSDKPVAVQRAGILAARVAALPLAERAFRRFVEIEPNSARGHAKLAQVLESQSKWWQAAESAATACSLVPANADWRFLLASLQERMGWHRLAIASYQEAISRKPGVPDWHYRLGYVLELVGDSVGAGAAYAKAVALDSKLEASRFGEGVFHAARGYWPEAAEAYQRQLRGHPADAQLHYRAGLAYDRAYDWEQAKERYCTAIALSPGVAYWHFRLGYVLERLEQWELAADAYTAALELSRKEVAYWHYRKGYVLAKAGLWEQACQAYMHFRPAPMMERAGGEAYRRLTARPDLIRALVNEDYSNWELHVALARQYERIDAWAQAAGAYAEAAARRDEHAPDLYSRLGVALCMAGRVEAACRAFEDMVVLRRPFGVDSRAYTRTAYQKMLVHYNEYRDCLSIKARTILYESYGGASTGDSPGAIFRHLVADPAYAGWTHIWVVEGRAVVPAEWRKLRTVVFVSKGSDLYLRYLASASHLVNNATFPPWFVRRDGQQYLNTWHGTPLKTMMKHIKGDFMGRKNTVRNLLQSTHLINPNQHTSDVLLRGGDIDGIFGGKVAETGYPRVDLMINAADKDKSAVLGCLGIADDRPVVLYAPTWRGTTFGDAVVEVDAIIQDLKALSSPKFHLVFRGHYSIASRIEELALPVIVAPFLIDTCELLAVTSVLVSDYSSILFDFLPARRPIICYAYDLEEFERERGLYFGMDALPWRLCKERSGLRECVEQSISLDVTSDPRYLEALREFCPHDDGRATGRVIEFFLNGDDSCVVDRYRDARNSILLYAGAFPPQGITASAINLLAGLDPRVDVVSLAIDPDAVASAPERMERFSRVPDAVQVLARFGSMLLNPEERWIRDHMNRRHFLPSARMWRIYKNAYRKEFERLFGTARFDALVDFDGYSIYWTSLFAFGARSSMRRTVYLHSEMESEYRTRFPSLAAVFSIMRDFDALVSVSPFAMRRNRESISRHGVDPSRFVACANVIQPEDIARKAALPLDDDIARFLEGGPTFLCLGRLSPEKGHAKLFEAFARVQELRPDARLLVVGDGPLRQSLERKVEALGLGRSILLAGPRSNPFPALRACQCLVMSSDHEGQPMVLLEAMTLGKPVIAVDIDGTRGLLAPNGYGMLVENSVQGLVKGFVDVLEGNSAAGSFDAYAYRTDALAQFESVVLGPGQVPARDVRTDADGSAGFGPAPGSVPHMRGVS